MKQSFKSSNSITQPSEEDTEADESLFYSAVDMLKSSDRSANVNINHSSDQSDYEESPVKLSMEVCFFIIIYMFSRKRLPFISSLPLKILNYQLR
jgi:hypothetical protein